MRSFALNTTFHRLLQLQGTLKQSINYAYPFQFRAMSSAQPPHMDPAIDQIISYWFNDERYPDPGKKWFGGGEKVDIEIQSHFSNFVVSARSGSLNSWTETPNGTLALLILLDQFPRNVYRGKADSFASDALGLKMATWAISNGQDRKVPHTHQQFFYMPFEHDESLISQVAGVSLLENWVARIPENATKREKESAVTSLDFAVRHRDVILKYGRFPGRNAALGRENTPEEEELLKTSPFGF
ncbi:hypothetical protein F5884DRAFT_777086 [Xylogone sp. PMI_703]|nr:hypothetical protein F5884DRAFT_777086 [Xylogone sp. PMI_703]